MSCTKLTQSVELNPLIGPSSAVLPMSCTKLNTVIPNPFIHVIRCSKHLSNNELKRLTDKDINKDINEAPVVKLVQSLFEDAMQMRASDIHIEPDENVLRIRSRIDSMLHEQIIPEKRIISSLVSPFKTCGWFRYFGKTLATRWPF